jgi:serine protease
MQRYLVSATLVACLSACSDLPTNPADGVPGSFAVGSPLADRYIVLVEDAPGVQASSIAAAAGLVPDFVYRRALTGFAAPMTPAQAMAMRDRPGVVLVEPDQIVSITATQSPVPSWGLDRIDERNLPLDDSYTYAVNGSGVRLYGLDTGIRTTHVDFTGRTAAGFSVYSGGTADCNGHGTHTASTAAGTTWGVAKGMTVIPVRVLNCSGFGSLAGVIAGVDWITQNATLPAVANMSLSAGGSSSLDAAVSGSIAAGIVYAAAAGNDFGANACTLSPARVAAVLTVGATDISDARAGFSNVGSCLDLFAPGVGIIAAWYSSNTAAASLNGTSMSAPHVAGAAGLYLQANPTATPAQVAGALVSNATTGAVSNPGSGSPNRLLYTGFITAGGPPNAPPVAHFSYTCDASLTCTFDGSSSTDDQGITQYEWLGPGGGVQATGPIWVKSFRNTGTITFSLRVTDAGGLSDTETQVVDIAPTGGGNAPPNASFTFSCTGLTCTFNASGSTDDDGIVSYSWADDSPQQLGTGISLTHTFASAGTRDVTLTVMDTDGATDTHTRSVTVSAPPPGNQPPTASFTYSCVNLVCTYDATGSTDDNAIVLYEWLGPGGGVLATGSTWTVGPYRGPGSFNLTLRVTDGGGLTDTVTQTIMIQ